MYNAAGTLLTTNSNGLLRSVLPADGVYTLLVRDRSAVNLGSYRVNLQDETNACAVNDTEAPVITLVRPTGGEVLPGGTTFRIQWQSDDNVAVAAHAIALSTDGGKTFADPFASLGGNSADLRLDPARRYRAQPDGGDPRHRHRRRRQCAIGHQRPADPDRLRLHAERSATYTYDALNRLTQVALSDGRTIQYTWDAAGNLAYDYDHRAVIASDPCLYRSLLELASEF